MLEDAAICKTSNMQNVRANAVSGLTSASCNKVHGQNEENRGRNRYNVEMFLCAYYISAGQTSLLQVQ